MRINNLIPENTEGFGGEKPPSARVQPFAHKPEYYYSYSASSFGMVILYFDIYLPNGTTI